MWPTEIVSSMAFLPPTSEQKCPFAPLGNFQWGLRHLAGDANDTVSWKEALFEIEIPSRGKLGRVEPYLYTSEQGPNYFKNMQPFLSVLAHSVLMSHHLEEASLDTRGFSAWNDKAMWIWFCSRWPERALYPPWFLLQGKGVSGELLATINL